MARGSESTPKPEAFHITHRYGDDERDPRLAAFTALLREIREEAGDDDAAVAVTHESGWAVCVSGGGLVTLENFERTDVEPRHLAGLGEEAIVSLFMSVADGRLDELLARPWQAGREPQRPFHRGRPALRRDRGRCPVDRAR